MNQGDLCPKCRTYYMDSLDRCPACDPKPTDNSSQNRGRCQVTDSPPDARSLHRFGGVPC